MNDGSSLLTIEEAARRLACSPQAIRRWIAQGRLHAVRLGRAVRLRVQDLERATQHGIPASPVR